MSFSPALVYDFIFLAVFSFAAVKSWQKGFLAGLTELIGAVLGVGIASWGSRTLAPEVYLSFFSDSVSTRVEQAVFALLVRLLRGVNLIPLVGGANRLLGLVLGLVTGAFDCWLLALLLWFAASITTGQIDWLTTGVLQRSVGYSLFGAFNPFLLHY